jgi:hypothetical protein
MLKLQFFTTKHFSHADFFILFYPRHISAMLKFATVVKSTLSPVFSPQSGHFNYASFQIHLVANWSPNYSVLIHISYRLSNHLDFWRKLPAYNFCFINSRSRYDNFLRYSLGSLVLCVVSHQQLLQVFSSTLLFHF